MICFFWDILEFGDVVYSSNAVSRTSLQNELENTYKVMYK